MAAYVDPQTQRNADVAVAALDDGTRARLAMAVSESCQQYQRWWLRQPSQQTWDPSMVNDKLKYKIFRAGLQDVLARMDMEVAMAEGKRANDLGRLNDQLFAELENLRAVDATDADMMAAEVARSKAVEGIARTVIENANTVLAATRMRAEYNQNQVSMPKMLEG